MPPSSSCLSTQKSLKSVLKRFIIERFSILQQEKRPKIQINADRFPSFSIQTIFKSGIWLVKRFTKSCWLILIGFKINVVFLLDKSQADIRITFWRCYFVGEFPQKRRRNTWNTWKKVEDKQLYTENKKIVSCVVCAVNLFISHNPFPWRVQGTACTTIDMERHDSYKYWKHRHSFCIVI